MSNYYYASQHHSSHANHPSHPHHSGRSRRATRAAQQHNHHKHLRALRLQKEAEDLALEKAWAFRRDFEAARSFDIDDDEMFCPFELLTDDDIHSIHSASSDRSSLSSGSPEHSPMQQQIQPTQNFLLPPSNAFSNNSFAAQTTKLHQPLAQRKANAIPIVDPTTRTVASPPPSVSPARQLAHGRQLTPLTSSRQW